MKKIMLMFAVVLFMGAQLLYAQTKDLTGTVTSSEDGTTVPGASIMVKGTTLGTVTDIDGNFNLRVPDDAEILVVSFVGMQTIEVPIANQTSFSIALQSDVFGLDEVVVTGVASGTATKKLGFSVAKVREDEIHQVPATNAANAMRGKVAGVRIVNPSGNPSSDASIRLRGSTNISGSQDPLIIVDGIITDGSLNDINMEDVASIEVVKGAAASALYGSLAGNGVIQILTKTGAGNAKPTVTIKQEYGFSQIARDYPVATHHGYALDANGDFVLVGGSRVLDTDMKFDNEYPELYDNLSNVFTSQPYYSTHVSLQQAADKYKYYLSFDNNVQGGAMENLEPVKRKNFRANFDIMPTDKFTAAVRVLYSINSGNSVVEQGQGDNFFYSVLMCEPFIDLTEKDENGDYVASPTGYEIQGSNWQNPLYVGGNSERTFTRNRFLGGANLSYDISPDLVAKASVSYDRSDYDALTYFPKGYETPISDITRNNGSMRITDSKSEALVYDVSLAYRKAFGDYNLSAVAKYMVEDRKYERNSAYGYNFAIGGVYDLDNTGVSGREMSSYQRQDKAENFFLSVDGDYLDKFIVGAMVRNDGSSLYGENERRHTYYRGSAAYRLSEDVTIPNVDELKLRVSYGVAGGRPSSFSAQYETYTVTSAGPKPQQLGNANLKSPDISELEFGLNATLFNKLSFEANYAMSNTKNDIISRPLQPIYGGFSDQWVNLGNIKSSALEFSLGGNVVDHKNFKWDFNFNWDKITQEISDLGGMPAFTRETSGTAINIFRVEEGLPYGTMYGNLMAKSLDDLIVNEAGMVVNDGGTHPLADYIVNEYGHIVRANTIGTADEQPLLITDENGTAVVDKMGDTNPDFNLGFSNTFTFFNSLTLYVLLDWQQGGDIYNYTKQLMYYNERHKDLETYCAGGKHVNYSNGSSALYNKSNPLDYYVEDGTFVKLRELSLAYNVSAKAFSNIGLDFFKGATFSVTGRNLITWTKYSGWDPEVAISTNPTNFKLDEFAYPNYRTFSGTVILKF